MQRILQTLMLPKMFLWEKKNRVWVRMVMKQNNEACLYIQNSNCTEFFEIFVNENEKSVFITTILITSFISLIQFIWNLDSKMISGHVHFILIQYYIPILIELPSYCFFLYTDLFNPLFPFLFKKPHDCFSACFNTYESLIRIFFNSTKNP